MDQFRQRLVLAVRLSVGRDAISLRRMGQHRSVGMGVGAGQDLGPAWVAWRSTSSYVGWAPLPPGVSLNVLSQLTFSGHPVTPGFDFGLVPSSYVFVRASRFLTADLPRHVIPAARAASLAGTSAVINNYTVVNNKIINGGVSRGVIAAAAKQPLTEVALEPVPSAPERVPAAVGFAGIGSCAGSGLAFNATAATPLCAAAGTVSQA